MIRLLPILLIGLLSACGQKGALMLPTPPKPPVAETPATEPAAPAADSQR